MLLGGCLVDAVPDLDAPPWEDGDRALERLVPSASTLVVAEGGTETLTLSAFYEGTAEPVVVTVAADWTSSDPEVAEVTSAGTVTGIAEGRTIVFGMLAGVQSDPVTVIVGRVYSLDANTAIARRGKLLNLVLTSPEADFTQTESIELSIAGLMPFADDRTADPWWGIVPGTTSSYEAVFLVPPTAPLGQREVVFRLDGASPVETLVVEIQPSDSLETAHGCDYFNEDSTSNWKFSNNGAGNQARTWLVSGGSSGTLTRFSARSITPGDVDPWMALWSLNGDLLITNDEGYGATTTDEASIELTTLLDDTDGAHYVTAAVSPYATASQAGGTIGTACVERSLPVHVADAIDGFPDSGELLLPGHRRKEFDFSNIGGSAARIYAYIDTDLHRPDVTTVTLFAPDGSQVNLIDPDWAEEVGVSERWIGTLGAPEPFTPTASEIAGGLGTLELTGALISGVWVLDMDIAAVGNHGHWRDARLWIESQ
jgi:hypothetical protein